MFTFLLIITVCVSVAGGFAYGMWQKTRMREAVLQKENEKLYENAAQFEQDLEHERNENTVLHERIQQFLQEKTQAITRLETVEKQLQQAIDKQQAAEEQAVHAVEQRFQYQKEAELAYQKVEEMENRIMDWENTKAESLKAAKAAMFETGTAAFRKEAENIMEHTQVSFKDIIASVAKVQERLGQNESVVNTVWNALKTPTGVGQMSEIGLENTLTSFGLEAGRDFVTQYSVSGEQYGSRLRPDAVVFLPANTLLVIDSKASKFFLELAEADEKDEDAIYAKLKKTMHEHLRSLSSKNYKDAVKDYIRTADKSMTADKIFTVMFLHSESAIEKIYRADSSFRLKAQELGIIVAGPTGLAGLMSLAQVEIQRALQDENQQQIIDELSGLLGYVETALGYAGHVGKSLRSAAEHYHKFTKSVNSRLLPKGRKLHELGIQLPKNKQLPSHLPEYHVLSDSTPVIEGSADDSNNTEADSNQLALTE